MPETTPQQTAPRVMLDIDPPCAPKLYAALVAAQAEFPRLVKDGTNPHFKSRYVTLDSAVEALTPILNKHGLTVLQLFVSLPEGAGIKTILAHVSGEAIAGVQPLLAVKNDPQGIASASTYARRYGLLGIVGVAPCDEDDDGEAAQRRNDSRPAQAAAKPAAPKHEPPKANDKPALGIEQARSLTLDLYQKWMTEIAFTQDIAKRVNDLENLPLEAVRKLYSEIGTIAKAYNLEKNKANANRSQE